MELRCGLFCSVSVSFLFNFLIYFFAADFMKLYGSTPNILFIVLIGCAIYDLFERENFFLERIFHIASCSHRLRSLKRSQIRKTFFAFLFFFNRIELACSSFFIHKLWINRLPNV